MLFFTSDTHFGHSNIMKYCDRPGLTEAELLLLKEERYYQSLKDKDQYTLSAEEKRILKGPEPRCRVSRESTERMDDYLINNINDLVGENDTLYHLGDFCFAPKNEYYNAARQYRNRIKCRNVHIIWGNHDHYSIGNLFSTANNMNTVFEGKQGIVLCHYAMAVWAKSHRGVWHLYGHSHAGAEAWLERTMPGRRAFDAGVDNAAKILGAYRPWTYDEIKTIMEKRNGCSIDHHRDD